MVFIVLKSCYCAVKNVAAWIEADIEVVKKFPRFNGIPRI